MPIADVSEEDGRPGVALAAAALGAGVDVLYVLAIWNQGADFDARVVFYAAFVGVMAVLSLAGAAIAGRDRHVAQAVLYGAETGYLIAGALGLASIGLPLILAGLLAFAAARPRRVSARIAVSAGALSAGAFIVGIVLT